MENNNFGTFLASLRKENNLTQKALAEKLYITDKAVSKWERGLSMPDISLLIPLSEILGVTVTELLECRKMEKNEKFDNEQIENIVKKTINISEEKSYRREPKFKQRTVAFIGFSAIAVLEVVFLIWFGCDVDTMGYTVFLVEGLMFTFGGYFWLFAKTKLPAYYDENRISEYSDGFFRMNLPGVYFNNNNWPHIVKSLRIWFVAVMLIYPAVYFFLYSLLSAQDGTQNNVIFNVVLLIFTFVAAFSMFIPMYRNGRKRET